MLKGNWRAWRSAALSLLFNLCPVQCLTPTGTTLRLLNKDKSRDHMLAASTVVYQVQAHCIVCLLVWAAWLYIWWDTKLCFIRAGADTSKIGTEDCVCVCVCDSGELGQDLSVYESSHTHTHTHTHTHDLIIRARPFKSLMIRVVLYLRRVKGVRNDSTVVTESAFRSFCEAGEYK